MKQKLLYLTIVTIGLLLLMHPTPSNAEGSVDSTVNMSVPVLTLNQQTTVTTAVTSTVMDPFYGVLHYYAMYNTQVLGSESNGQVSSATPVIKFSISQSRSISVIRLPVSAITNIANMGATLNYNIANSQSTVLLSGTIGKYALTEMLSKGYILLLFNSPQTTTTALSLSAGETYSITLDDPTGVVTFTLPTSPSTTTEFYDGPTATGNSVPVILQDTNKLAAIDLQTGNSDLTFTPTFLFDQMLAYFDDPLNDYQTSFDLQSVTFNSSNNYTFTVSNTTAEQDQSVSIPVILENNGVGVANTAIHFQVQINSYYVDLGSYTTGSSGLVNFPFSASYTPGVYNLLISAEPQSDALSTVIQITITPPKLTITGLTASGMFGSGTGNVTVYTVSGYVEDSSGLKISALPLDLSHLGSVVNSTTTSSTGYFSFSSSLQLQVGTYTSYFSLSSSTTDYIFTTQAIDLVIAKGRPVISLQQSNYSLSYQDPFVVSGTVTDQSGDMISADLTIQIYNNSLWTTITSFSTTGSFSTTLPSDYTGQYAYRVKSAATIQYFGVETNFNAIIGKISASLSSDKTSYSIEYHGSTGVTITLQTNRTDEIGLDIYLQSPFNGSQYTLVSSGYTNSLIYSFTINATTGYEQFAYLDFYAMIVAHSTIYQVNSLSIPFQIVPTTINPTLVPGSYMIKQSGNIAFQLTDGSGKAVDDNLNLTMTFDSGTHQVKSSGGMISLNYAFSTPGWYTITLQYSPSLSYPYSPFGTNFTIFVSKGYLTFDITNGVVHQGNIYTFTGTVRDQVSDTVNTTVTLDYYNTTTGLWSQISSTSTINGYYQYQLLFGTSYGRTDHQFRVSIDNSSLYDPYSKIITVTVDKTVTDLQITTPAVVNYNSAVIDRTVGIQLSTFAATPLSGTQQVRVTFNSVVSTITLDASGNGEYILPNQQLPGNYQLQIEYLGTQNYVANSNTSQITVIGIPSLIEWTTQPQNTYYGNYMPIGLRVYDGTGSSLSGMTVTIKINNAQVAVGVTNSTGYVDFNIQMLFSNESLNVQVIVSPKAGWEGTTQNFTVVQHKRIIAADIGLQNGSNMTAFGSNVDLKIKAYSDVETQLGSTTITIYVIDPINSNQIYVGRYVSNSTGWLLISLNLPNYSVSQDYLLEIVFTKQYYTSVTQQHAIDITPIDFNYTVNTTSGNYLQTVSVSVSFTGIDVVGTEVNITIQDTVHNLLFTGSYDGTDLVFSFTALKAGTITIGYEFRDLVGNYNFLSGNTVVTVGKADPVVSTSQVDINGIGYLNISIAVGTTPVTAYVDVSYLAASYTVLIKGNGLIQIDAITSYTLAIQTTTDLNSSTTTVTVSQSQTQLDFLTTELYTQQTNMVTVEIMNQAGLNNHYLELYLVTSTGDQYLASAYSNDSIVVFTVSYKFALGTAMLKVVYPQQSFFSAANSSRNYTVGKIDLTIDVAYDQFIGNQPASISLGTTLPVDFPSTQYFYLYLGNNLLASEVLTNSVTILVDVPSLLGNYNLRLFVNETIVSNRFDQSWSVQVLQQTGIEVVSQSVSGYGDNNSVVLLLYSNDTKAGIPNQIITIYECGIFCSTSSKQIATITTNSTGYAVFFIPVDFQPNIYQFYAYYDFADNIHAQSDSQFKAQVFPEQTFVRTEVIDFGVTHNITLAIGIYDETGLLNTTGKITVVFNDTTSIVKYNGQLIELSYLKVIGDYSIQLQFTPDNDYFVSSSNSTEIGWQQIDPTGISFDLPGSQRYYDNLSVSITYQNTSLTDLSLQLYVNGDYYGNYTLHDGHIELLILLKPGSYELMFMLSDNYWMSGQWSKISSVEIEKGSIPFTFTADPVDWGQPVAIQISDKVNNASYFIRITGLGFDYNYTTTSLSVTLDLNLGVGNYSLTIQRIHLYLESTLVRSTLEIKPLYASLTVTETGMTLQFTLNPEKSLDNFYFVLFVSNDTHQFNYTVYSLELTLNLGQGNYVYQYYLYGSYTGSGNGILELHQDQSQGSTTGFQLPGLNSGASIGIGLVAIYVAAMVYTKVKGKKQV